MEKRRKIQCFLDFLTEYVGKYKSVNSNTFDYNEDACSPYTAQEFTGYKRCEDDPSSNNMKTINDSFSYY